MTNTSVKDKDTCPEAHDQEHMTTSTCRAHSRAFRSLLFLPSPMDSLKPELWTSSSNDIQVLLTNNGEVTPLRPLFTYPIFGDSETVFGFKELQMFLCFDHYTFFPFYNAKWLDALADAVDPKDALARVLPLLAVYKDEMQWLEASAKEKLSYEIPGARVARWHDMSVYKIDLTASAGVELLRRVQVMVLLYIEAGSYIDASDPLWEFYVVYRDADAELEDQEPSLAGFVTAYNYWKYPGASAFDAGTSATRKKISQFVVLPPFQGRGVGAAVYTALFDLWLADLAVGEIVVEDPNEAFDDMRDKADLARLRKAVDWQTIDLARLGLDWYHQFRKSLKLERRQYSRLMEMVLLSNYQKYKQIRYKDVRLFIKNRLYQKNREALMSLEKPVRMDKLQTAYQALEEDYYRILGMSTRGGFVEGPDLKRVRVV